MPRIILNTECLIKNDIRSVLACSMFKEPLIELYTKDGWSFTIISDTLVTVYYARRESITSTVIPSKFLKFPCSTFKNAAVCERHLNDAMHEVLARVFNNPHIPPVISTTPIKDCSVIRIAHIRSNGSIMTKEFSIDFLEERSI
ncbi:MAG: hypothetical protein PHT13_00985 [Methanosarcina sp.]|nr:hypothetical protein [Methanosarcina sp.]